MKGDERELTGKPEGRNFLRGGGKDGLQRSTGVLGKDTDLNGFGRGEVFGGE